MWEEHKMKKPEENDQLLDWWESGKAKVNKKSS
jgi:hypothetical protein